MEEPPQSRPTRDRGEISDEIRAYLDGDTTALDDIVAWLTPLMESWAQLHLGSLSTDAGPTAEDVVQDVWLRVLPQLPRLRPHPTAASRHTAALVGLVRTALVRRILDLRRAASRRRLKLQPLGDGPLAEPRSPDSGPLSRVLRGERRRLVAELLDRLDARERAIYVTRVFELASVAELAQRFGVTPASVRSIHGQVRRRLARLIDARLLDDLDHD